MRRKPLGYFFLNAIAASVFRSKKSGDGADTSIAHSFSDSLIGDEIDCGSDCNGSYESGTVVILTAQPDEDNGVSFVGAGRVSLRE